MKERTMKEQKVPSFREVVQRGRPNEMEWFSIAGTERPSKRMRQPVDHSSIPALPNSSALSCSNPANQQPE
jgi:hypothetical protein